MVKTTHDKNSASLSSQKAVLNWTEYKFEVSITQPMLQTGMYWSIHLTEQLKCDVDNLTWLGEFGLSAKRKVYNPRRAGSHVKESLWMRSLYRCQHIHLLQMIQWNTLLSIRTVFFFFCLTCVYTLPGYYGKIDKFYATRVQNLFMWKNFQVSKHVGKG